MRAGEGAAWCLSSCLKKRKATSSGGPTCGRSVDPRGPPYNAASVHRRACLALPVTSVTGVPDGLPYRVWPAAVGLLLL